MLCPIISIHLLYRYKPMHSIATFSTLSLKNSGMHYLLLYFPFTKQNEYKNLTNKMFILFSASHWRFITGGVRWRKLGIFISSAFAHLSGVGCPEAGYPCRTGKGTVAGWNVLAVGHTLPQSWSVFCCLYL